MDLLKNMSDPNLTSLLNQALTAGESDLVAMVRNELLRRARSIVEETDPIHHLPGAVPTWHPREPLRPEPRLWPPRQIKTQPPKDEGRPVAPHDTAELITALEDWRHEVSFSHSPNDLLGKAIEQLRWYADSRAAEEVGY